MGWVLVLLELVDILGSVLHGGSSRVMIGILGLLGAASVMALSRLTLLDTSFLTSGTSSWMLDGGGGSIQYTVTFIAIKSVRDFYTAVTFELSYTDLS